MMTRIAIGLLFALGVASQGGAEITPRHAGVQALDADARQDLDKNLLAAAGHWDEKVRLLRTPDYVPGRRFPGTPEEDHHYWEKCCFNVRGTAEYALGLLLRDAKGDRERAAEALDATLKQQHVTPGVKWYGTFTRTPEEGEPGPRAVMWQDYDPNWREFIGTTFEIILIEFPDRIPGPMVPRLYAAIDHAVAGEMADGRLVPTYTNPALMFGALCDFAATHDRNADWHAKDEAWTKQVFGLFKRYGTFDEFNSPTYAGVDLFALALWRQYGSNETMRSEGAFMEAKLWQDVGTFYQPDLHNLCGPFDRAYGMDMETDRGGVVALMRYAKDGHGAAVALAEKPRGGGFSYTMAVLGTRIPEDALANLQRFEGDHFVRRQITEQRMATAWIGKHVMFGGESTSKTRDVGKNSQFHPVTVHWRTPSGEIGWVIVALSGPLDATADEKGLTISTTGDLRFRIHAKGLVSSKVRQTEWALPGLRVAVSSDAHGEIRVGEADPSFNQYLKVTDNMIDVVYPAMTRIRLDIKADESK